MKKFLNSLKNKVSGIILALVLIIVIASAVGFIKLYGKLEEVGNQLMYLQDTNSILQLEVANLQTNIEATLEEEASLIETYSVEVLSMNFEKETYRVKVSVVPKEYSETTKASIFFGAIEFPLTLNRYSFEGEMDLSFHNSYDANVTFLFSNGDKKTTEVIKDYIGLQTRLKDLLYGSIPEIPNYRNGELVFSDYIDYTLNEYSGYDYKSLELVVMADNEELQVVDLVEAQIAQEEDSNDNNTPFWDIDSWGRLEDTQIPEESNTSENNTSEQTDGNNPTDSQDENSHTTETDTSESDESIGENGTGTIPSGGNTGENGTEATPSDEFEKVTTIQGLSGGIHYKQKFNVEAGKTIRVFLRAKNESGFTLEYNLFSAITSETDASGYEETNDYFLPDYTIYDERGNKWKL